jgi:hypothetical protein
MHARRLVKVKRHPHSRFLGIHQKAYPAPFVASSMMQPGSQQRHSIAITVSSSCD